AGKAFVQSFPENVWSFGCFSSTRDVCRDVAPQSRKCWRCRHRVQSQANQAQSSLCLWYYREETVAPTLARLPVWRPHPTGCILGVAGYARRGWKAQCGSSPCRLAKCGKPLAHGIGRSTTTEKQGLSCSGFHPSDLV